VGTKHQIRSNPQNPRKSTRPRTQKTKETAPQNAIHTTPPRLSSGPVPEVTKIQKQNPHPHRNPQHSQATHLPQTALYNCKARSTNRPFFCKTNPISKTPKSTQPLSPQRFTPISRSAPPQKTNPTKPNLPRTRRHTTYEIRNQPPASRMAKSNTFCPLSRPGAGVLGRIIQPRHTIEETPEIACIEQAERLLGLHKPIIHKSLRAKALFFLQNRQSSLYFSVFGST